MNYGKFWTNVMSTRVRVGEEEEEEEELRQSVEMISEGRTSYYNYRPANTSDLAENYTDFVSILQDYRGTDEDGDEVEIIEKTQIRESSEPANSNMKDDNQVRTVIRYFSLYVNHLTILLLPKSKEYLHDC